MLQDTYWVSEVGKLNIFIGTVTGIDLDVHVFRFFIHLRTLFFSWNAKTVATLRPIAAHFRAVPDNSFL